MPIIPTLPYILTNGTLANADEVMADFYAIVNGVNTNALPSGGALTAGLEWTLLNDAPTFIAFNVFSVPGDQTSTFTIGRRVKTVNTAGTTYSTIIGVTLVLNTLVSVSNTSGALDSGLSAVSIGTLDAVNPSSPVTGYVSGIGSTTLASAVLTPLVLSVGPDYLSEWSAPSTFHPRVDGTYRFSYIGGELATNGVDVAASSNFQMAVYLNGSGSGTTLVFTTWPYGAGVQQNTLLISASITVPMVVGDTAQTKAIFQTFTGAGPMLLNNGQLIIQRLLF